MEGRTRSNPVEKTKILPKASGLICLTSLLLIQACGIGFDLKGGTVGEDSAAEATPSVGSDSLENNPSSDPNNPNTWEEDPFFEEANLPSVLVELDDSSCDAMSAELQHPGATSYFVGTYIKRDGGWVGREKWILFPNEYWMESGGFPCEVSWDIETREEELTTCLACDLALGIDASISPSSTNCPQGLWNEPSEQYWSSTYEIRMNNGTSTFYFQSNGNAFGAGYSSERAINFISDPDCKWF